MTYYVPRGGLPPQRDLTTDRAVFTEAYAVLPRGTMRDIVDQPAAASGTTPGCG